MRNIRPGDMVRKATRSNGFMWFPEDATIADDPPVEKIPARVLFLVLAVTPEKNVAILDVCSNKVWFAREVAMTRVV